MENVPHTPQENPRNGQRIRDALNEVVAASGALSRSSLDAAQEGQVLAIRSAAGRILEYVESTMGELESECRLLLVEDDRINQRVMTRMLARLGHVVTTVGTGRAAIDALDQEHFDVVFMDILMPGISGLQAIRLIRERLPDRRQPWIVALTAAVLPEDRLACREAGADDLLAKPVRGEDLQAAIDGAPRRVNSVANIIPMTLPAPGQIATSTDPEGPVDVPRRSANIFELLPNRDNPADGNRKAA